MRQLLIRDNYGASFFDNNIDFYEFIRSMEKKKKWEHIERHGHGDSWAGGVTYEDTMTELLYGNKEITHKFLDGLKNLGQETFKDTGIFMNTEGFAYDMGAVVSGEPECCVDMKAPESKKSLTILMDYTAPCYVDSKNLLRRGLAVANLIYTLIEKGYVINLNVCAAVKLHYTGTLFSGEKVRKHLLSIGVPVETLSLGTIGFYTSVEFFRILYILAEGMLLDANHQCGESVGTDDIEDYSMAENVFLVPNTYLDKRGEKLDTQEQANEYVKTLFKEYCEKHNLTEEI